MKSNKWMWLVIVLMFTIIFSACGGGDSISTYSISGTISTSGMALQGVTMKLNSAGYTSAITDTSGNYTFTGLVNGSYMLIPSMTDYFFIPSSLQVTVNNMSITGQNFTARVILMPKFAYVANTGENTISGYTMNQNTGALTAGTPVASGQSPAAVTVDPSGRFAYTANAGEGTISVYTINQTTGALTAGTPVISGSGPNSTPHSVTVDPLGRFAYTANAGEGTISVYTINQTTGALTAGTPAVSGSGRNSTPYSVTVDPSGRYAYSANNGDGTISVYTINQTTGALTAGTPVVSGSGPNSTPYSVTVDPSGRFAYAANAVDGTISVYNINQTTGVLTAGTLVASGLSPNSNPTYIITTGGNSVISRDRGILKARNFWNSLLVKGRELLFK
jgi:6-phosphogluconolactonase (cycloisomerase 2 family)